MPRTEMSLISAFGDVIAANTLPIHFPSCFSIFPTNAPHLLSLLKAGTPLALTSKIARSGSHGETRGLLRSPLGCVILLLLFTVAFYE